MNAKDEMLQLLGGKQIKCAIVTLDYYLPDQKSITLKVGHDEKDFLKFLSDLDFKYDNGYGGQELYGAVWFDDGTWAERGEYDGSEWWNVMKLPQIPKELLS